MYAISYGTAQCLAAAFDVDLWTMHDFLGRDSFCFLLLTPDLVSHQRWSSVWCARGLCTAALDYCAPLSPGAAGCVMALLPSGKAHWGLQLHYSWKNTTIRWLNQYNIACGCAMWPDPFKGWGGKAMFSPWDTRLTRASTWCFCNIMERENYTMQLWRKKSGLQLCCGKQKGNWETSNCCSTKAISVLSLGYSGR